MNNIFILAVEDRFMKFPFDVAEELVRRVFRAQFGEEPQEVRREGEWVLAGPVAEDEL